MHVMNGAEFLLETEKAITMSSYRRERLLIWPMK